MNHFDSNVSLEVVGSIRNAYKNKIS